MRECAEAGVYALCEYQDDSLIELAKWIEAHDDLIPMPVTSDNIHTTVVYSRSNFQIPTDVDAFNQALSELKFYPAGLTILGRQNDDKKALAILLDAGPLIDLHNMLKESGASHDFDDYIPHITVSYEISDDFDISQIALPEFCFKPEKINFKPLNTNWCLQDTKDVI